MENGSSANADEKEILLPRTTNTVPYGGLDHSDQRPYKRTDSVKGSTISFHGISYVVKTKEDGKKINKVILNDVTGIFGPGMNAILGPTGSGKTSLLNVLAARKDPTGLAGTVLINGQAQPSNFRFNSGYVVQEDVVMGTLTVRENLEFSANLRLSKSVSKQERKNRVDDVINELGLNLCSETKVGTEMIRGISGGERKRTNVGLELIIKPSVLFLDEPTTGLDASTANAVMILLSRLTKRGRTIIFSIHQPRYSIYKLFDKLHLLSLGNTVYHGPVNDALPYFCNIGYVCEEHNNPPDFFLDIINGDSMAVTKAEEEIKPDKTEETTVNVGANAHTISDKISRLFKASLENSRLMEAAGGIFKEFLAKDEIGTNSITYPTSFTTQLYYLSKRTALNVIRNPLQSYMQFLFLIIFALVVGGLYFQLDLTYPSGLQNRVGAFFFLIMNMIFSNLSAVELFINERIVYVHESASGFYRSSSYFFAKVFCDLLPMRILPTFFFSAITYWMIGFKQELAPFLIYCLTLCQTTITASALSFSISSSVSIMAVGTLLLSVVFVFMMIFGGLLLNISTLPTWLQWLQYFSVFRFSLNAMLVNELDGLKFCIFVNGTAVHCESGTDYLEQQGIDHTTWGLWKNEVALAGLSLGFFILAYIQLRRIRKLK